MRQQPGHRLSIFCIVPPDVLRDIARNGAEEERQAALDTMVGGPAWTVTSTAACVACWSSATASTR